MTQQNIDDLFDEVDSLKTQIAQLNAQNRVGRVVYGGPITVDYSPSMRTNSYMWVLDSGHPLEFTVPVQNYVYQIISVILRLKPLAVRSAAVASSTPDIATSDDNAAASSSTTTDDNSAASSAATTNDSSPASSATTTDDSAAASSASTVDDDSSASSASTSDDAAGSSSASTTDSDSSQSASASGAAFSIPTGSHNHLWAAFVSSTPLGSTLRRYQYHNSGGTLTNNVDIATQVAEGVYTGLANGGTVSVSDSTHTHGVTGHSHGMTHTHNHHHGMAHTHLHHHGMAHTHSHHHDMTHTHTHHHDMSHTHNHHHDMSHTHNHHHTHNHTHPMSIASSVTEGGSASAMSVYLDTGAGFADISTALGGPFSVATSIDITAQFNDLGVPPQPRLGNHTMRITSATVGTVEAVLDWYVIVRPPTTA